MEQPITKCQKCGAQFMTEEGVTQIIIVIDKASGVSRAKIEQGMVLCSTCGKILEDKFNEFNQKSIIGNFKV